jgi:hypothetical protein
MKWIYGLLCVLCFVGGILVTRQMMIPKPVSKDEATIILEKIKDVFKLVLVEAHFNELYTHKQYQWFDISPFRKSAIIRIQAKITAGVNMDSAKIQIDENDKKIILRFNHKPVILYMDHKLDYYDLQQGTFNAFNSAELTAIQNKAKDIILAKAYDSDMLEKSTVKREQMIGTLEQLLESIGWTLVVEDIQSNTSFIH